MTVIKHRHGSLTYFVFQPPPSVIVLSGVHGNEYESGTLLERELIHHPSEFGHFLYVPRVSPSAIRLKRRTNANGLDVNRQFTDHSTDSEVTALMALLCDVHASIAIDVHEDPDNTDNMYVYDTAVMNPGDLKRYRDTVTATGMKLFTGIDDVDDECLMRRITDGYVSYTVGDSNRDPGFAVHWMVRHGIIKRGFTVEIPGKATAAVKSKIIDSVIPMLIQAFSK